MAIELFQYYLTGRHFTVVTDHASLTWLRNFKEPEGMVARWIACLQPFDLPLSTGPANTIATRMGYQDEPPDRAREKPVPSVSHFGKKTQHRLRWPAATPRRFRINVILMGMLRCLRRMLPCSGK